MEVLINIPQKAYEQIVGFPQQTAGVDILILHKILQEGKVLPKGHGRLIDGDLLKEQNCCSESYVRLFTIVEADKEVDE